MTDMAKLLDGLQTYEHQLELHSMQVSDSFDQLTKALDRLSAVYEGTAAKEFKAHFARTREGLADYSEGTKTIQHLLRERIERLAAADRPEVRGRGSGGVSLAASSTGLASTPTGRASLGTDDECQKAKERKLDADKRMRRAVSEFGDATILRGYAQSYLSDGKDKLKRAREVLERARKVPMSSHAGRLSFVIKTINDMLGWIPSPPSKSWEFSVFEIGVRLAPVGIERFRVRSIKRPYDLEEKADARKEDLKEALKQANRVLRNARSRYDSAERNSKRAEWSVRQICGGDEHDES